MTSTNIKELEKFKYDQNKKRSERARKVIKLIESLEEIEVTTFKVRENVTLHIIINEPTSRIFDEFNLDQKIEDDRIIASVLQLADSKEEKISIITNDLNLRLKAKLFGISVFNLTEEFELEQELDSNEKKIRQLTDELMRYKNSLPDLKILFHDKTEIQEFILEKPAVDQIAHIDEQMKLIKIKYQPKEFPQKDSFAYLPLSIGGMFTEKDYQNYNEELKKIYTTYEAYLIKKIIKLNKK